MLTILINPWTRKVTEHVLFADAFLEEAYAVLSAPPGWNVSMIEVLKIGESQYLVIDEEAKLKRDGEHAPAFQWGGVPEWTVVGKALVVDVRDDDFVGTSLTRDYVEKLVKWEEKAPAHGQA